MNDKQAANIASLIIFEVVELDDGMSHTLNTVVKGIAADDYMAKIQNANKHWFKYVKVKGRSK